VNAAALSCVPVTTASQPLRKRGRRATRILVVATLVATLWAGLSVATVRAAEATPQQYAKALRYAITKDLQQRGYAIRTVVVQPYHPVEIAKGVRVAQFQVWVAYVHRGQARVLYLVITPTGDVLDQTMVKSIGDTGGLLG
jgi:hypothetical protein